MNRLKIIRKRAEKKGIYVTKLDDSYFVVNTSVWMGDCYLAKSYRDAVVHAYRLAMMPPIVVNIFPSWENMKTPFNYLGDLYA